MEHADDAGFASLEALYEERFGDFLRGAGAITGSVDAGHDAVQEAFAKLLRTERSFRGEGRLAGWAWRTVVNTACDARRRAEVEQRQATAAVEPRSNGHTAEHGVRVLIALLPERQRLAVFLRYYADLDYRQIAEALEVTEGTVAATLHKAHAALRTSLEGVKP